MDKRPTLVYITYMFENISSFEEGVSFGYKTPIHCNYIQKIYTDDLNNKLVSLSFSNDTVFRFMQDSTGISGSYGYGWNAEKLYAIIQLIDTEDETVKPLPNEWRKVDVTEQINNYTTWTGGTIPPDDIVGSVMSISYDRYINSPKYDLSYLNYPLTNEENNLVFGEEVFFFGNVNGEIKATIYEMEVNIILPLNEFNSSTNPTWTINDPVYITEVGLYDDDGNLLAIGKLNYPIDKDSTKYRTITLKLDF
jgi:hypothetical protein